MAYEIRIARQIKIYSWFFFPSTVQQEMGFKYDKLFLLCLLFLVLEHFLFNFVQCQLHFALAFISSDEEY
jgi:hypothetical protein